MTGKKILVVDDSDLSRRLIGGLLSSEGWCVLAAADGAEGAVVALRDEPDVVVTDLEMPVMDGFQLARLLKSDPASAGTPVLMMTSHGDATSRFWGLETGADAYLLKTEVKSQLVPAVRELLSTQPRQSNQSIDNPPQTPLDVLARIGSHLDERLLEAVLINRVLERGMEAEDLATASHAALETVADLVDCWVLGLVVEEMDAAALYLRTDHALDDPALQELVNRVVDGPRVAVAGDWLERVRWRSEIGPASGSLGEPTTICFPLRGGRATLLVVPRTPLRGDGREPGLLSAITRHLALVLDNARLAQRLRELSMMDGLTRLLNRRTVHNRLVQEIERANRYQQPLSLMLCDLDRFKSINDTHGHLTGDVVLRVVADLFREHARAADIVGRFGGEEFVLILPNVELDQAALAAHRLLDALASDPIRISEGLTISVTASFGVAALGEVESASSDALLALADLRLYEAKNAGRARVVP